MRGMTAALTGLAIVLTVPGLAQAGSFEDEVMRELNRVRADPAGYASVLSRERAEIGVKVDERADPRAFAEAVDFLKRQSPMPPLDPDDRLAGAAEEFALTQGPSGAVGHGAPGGLGRRIQSQGVWAGLAGETISYGQPTAFEVVRQLVIDFGVPNRGHREIIFDNSFKAAGVGCGHHAAYGEMCVIDFAGAYAPQRAAKALPHIPANAANQIVALLDGLDELLASAAVFDTLLSESQPWSDEGLELDFTQQVSSES